MRSCKSAVLLLGIITSASMLNTLYRLFVQMNKWICRGIFGKKILIRVEFVDFCIYLRPIFFFLRKFFAY
jgi:hypothetical protein